MDVRRLKMLQMVQLFKCEEDSLQVLMMTLKLQKKSNSYNACACACACLQAVQWLGELLDALLKTHIRLGDDAQETRNMLDKHRKFVEVAQVNFTVESNELIINY